VSSRLGVTHAREARRGLRQSTGGIAHGHVREPAQVATAYASESETALGPIVDVVSSYLTVMGNAMLAPQLGPIRPSALVGAGLLRENLEFTGATNVPPIHRSHFGLDVGGGLIGFVSEHVGLRGDIRYFPTPRGCVGGGPC
jgi:hypothetical protein